MKFYMKIFVRSVQILLPFDKIICTSSIFLMKYLVIFNLSILLKSGDDLNSKRNFPSEFKVNKCLKF